MEPTTTLCAKCGKAFDRVNRRLRCLACLATAAREWRASKAVVRDGIRIPYQPYAEWSEEKKQKERDKHRRRYYDPQERPKFMARVAARAAVTTGRLVRRPCEVCGDPKSEAHHDDYNRPLDVRWFCRRDHAAWHRENTATPIQPPSGAQR